MATLTKAQTSRLAGRYRENPAMLDEMRRVFQKTARVDGLIERENAKGDYTLASLMGDVRILIDDLAVGIFNVSLYPVERPERSKS